MFNMKIMERQTLKMTVGFPLGPRPCGGAVLRGVWLARNSSQEEREGSSGARGTAGCDTPTPTLFLWADLLLGIGGVTQHKHGDLWFVRDLSFYL